jgi:hypothetical protein
VAGVVAQDVAARAVEVDGRAPDDLDVDVRDADDVADTPSTRTAAVAPRAIQSAVGTWKRVSRGPGGVRRHQRRLRRAMTDANGGARHDPSFVTLGSQQPESPLSRRRSALTDPASSTGRAGGRILELVDQACP